MPSWHAWAGVDVPLGINILFPGLAAAAKSLQLCLTLCDPIDSSPPGSPVPGILQARTLGRVAISFSNAWKWKVKVKSLSHGRLSDPMGCSLRGSSVHGIFQARALEWGAIAFSAEHHILTLPRELERNASRLLWGRKILPQSAFLPASEILLASTVSRAHP